MKQRTKIWLAFASATTLVALLLFASVRSASCAFGNCFTGECFSGSMCGHNCVCIRRGLEPHGYCATIDGSRR